MMRRVLTAVGWLSLVLAATTETWALPQPPGSQSSSPGQPWPNQPTSSAGQGPIVVAPQAVNGVPHANVPLMPGRPSPDRPVGPAVSSLPRGQVPPTMRHDTPVSPAWPATNWNRPYQAPKTINELTVSGLPQSGRLVDQDELAKFHSEVYRIRMATSEKDKAEARENLSKMVAAQLSDDIEQREMVLSDIEERVKQMRVQLEQRKKSTGEIHKMLMLMIEQPQVGMGLPMEYMKAIESSGYGYPVLGVDAHPNTGDYSVTGPYSVTGRRPEITAPTQPTEGREIDGSNTNDDQPQADKSQADKSQADESQADESQADKSQADESQADKSEADKSEADEAQVGAPDQSSDVSGAGYPKLVRELASVSEQAIALRAATIALRAETIALLQSGAGAEASSLDERWEDLLSQQRLVVRLADAVLVDLVYLVGASRGEGVVLGRQYPFYEAECLAAASAAMHRAEGLMGLSNNINSVIDTQSEAIGWFHLAKRALEERLPTLEPPADVSVDRS